MYIGLGIFLLVVGAILYFAVGTAVIGPVSISMIGLICMIGGVLAIVLSFLQGAGRRGGAGTGYTATRESHVDPN
ncbi:MAG TPA: DUF6458 family protein [Phycicoccus sp.]|jgi:hypothetical protein|nr:DUF6458 family protein [Phycicoccus sp.]